MYLTTAKGYDFFEASSAFQKSVRRNDEPTALYFMVELFNSGYAEYVWKRIKIITSEDIGLAYPSLPAIIAALYQSYTDVAKEKKDGKPERIFITHATIQICRAPKSRLNDYAMIKHWRGHDDQKLAIPDYAFDQHTKKGKVMGRGLDHFFTDGAHVENAAVQPLEPEYKTAAYQLRKNKPGKLSFGTMKRGNMTHLTATYGNDLFDNEEE